MEESLIVLRTPSLHLECLHDTRPNHPMLFNSQHNVIFILFYTYRMDIPHTSVQDTETVMKFDLQKATLHSGTEPPLYQEAINIESIQLTNTEPPPPSYNSSIASVQLNVDADN